MDPAPSFSGLPKQALTPGPGCTAVCKGEGPGKHGGGLGRDPGVSGWSLLWACGAALGHRVEPTLESCCLRGQRTGLVPRSSCLSLVGGAASRIFLRKRKTSGRKSQMESHPRPRCRRVLAGHPLRGALFSLCHSPHPSLSPVLLVGGCVGFLPCAVILSVADFPTEEKHCIPCKRPLLAQDARG